MDRPSNTTYDIVEKFLETLAGSTLAQRRTYLHEYLTYLGSAMPSKKGEPTMNDVLDQKNIDSWLAAARNGETRRRAGGRELRAVAAPNSMAARITTINTFSRFCGRPLRLPRPKTEPADRLTPVEAHRTVRLLVSHQPPRMTAAAWERSVAIVALAVCTGHGMSGLHLMRLRDAELGYRLPRVRVAGEWYPLDAFTGKVLTRWLMTRRAMMSSGSRRNGPPVENLWVTVKCGRRRGNRVTTPASGGPATLRTLVAAQRNLTTQVLGVPLRLEQFCAAREDNRHQHPTTSRISYPTRFALSAQVDQRFSKPGIPDRKRLFPDERRIPGGNRGR
ncbi:MULTISPECIES: hypothetical protein [Streptomyces]|uniref:hypothetical protein n=1 Tax=Streptomyces TaxID=1883 RepID=UPI00114CF092|nr:MULTISPECIES: hypothetical protein [Streptomyces]